MADTADPGVVELEISLVTQGAHLASTSAVSMRDVNNAAAAAGTATDSSVQLGNKKDLSDVPLEAREDLEEILSDVSSATLRFRNEDVEAAYVEFILRAPLSVTFGMLLAGALYLTYPVVYHRAFGSGALSLAPALNVTLGSLSVLIALLNYVVVCRNHFKLSNRQRAFAFERFGAVGIMVLPWVAFMFEMWISLCVKGDTISDAYFTQHSGKDFDSSDCFTIEPFIPLYYVMIPLIYRPRSMIQIPILLFASIAVKGASRFLAQPGSTSDFILRWGSSIAFACIGCGLSRVLDAMYRKRFVVYMQARAFAHNAKLWKTTLDQTLNATFPRHALQDVVTNRIGITFVTTASVSVFEIFNFLQWSTKALPMFVVNVVNALQSSFDTDVAGLGLAKISVLGDRYVVGTPLESPQPLLSRNVVAAAINQVAHAQALCTVLEQPINVHASIHHGQLIGMTVGTKTLSYEVFGPALSGAVEGVKFTPQDRVSMTPVAAETVGILNPLAVFEQARVAGVEAGDASPVILLRQNISVADFSAGLRQIAPEEISSAASVTDSTVTDPLNTSYSSDEIMSMMSGSQHPQSVRASIAVGDENVSIDATVTSRRAWLRENIDSLSRILEQGRPSNTFASRKGISLPLTLDQTFRQRMGRREKDNVFVNMQFADPEVEEAYWKHIKSSKSILWVASLMTTITFFTVTMVAFVYQQLFGAQDGDLLGICLMSGSTVGMMALTIVSRRIVLPRYAVLWTIALSWTFYEGVFLFQNSFLNHSYGYIFSLLGAFFVFQGLRRTWWLTLPVILVGALAPAMAISHQHYHLTVGALMVLPMFMYSANVREYEERNVFEQMTLGELDAQLSKEEFALSRCMLEMTFPPHLVNAAISKVQTGADYALFIEDSIAVAINLCRFFNNLEALATDALGSVRYVDDVSLRMDDALARAPMMHKIGGLGDTMICVLSDKESRASASRHTSRRQSQHSVMTGTGMADTGDTRSELTDATVQVATMLDDLRRAFGVEVSAIASQGVVLLTIGGRVVPKFNAIGPAVRRVLGLVTHAPPGYVGAEENFTRLLPSDGSAGVTFGDAQPWMVRGVGVARVQAVVNPTSSS